MQFEKVVRKRRSVRKFADRPVDTDLIKEVVMFAQRSPSWVNSQPWQVYCASGNSLAEIKRRYQQNDDQGVPTNPDLAVMSREQWAPQEQANMKQWGHQIVHHLLPTRQWRMRASPFTIHRWFYLLPFPRTAPIGPFLMLEPLPKRCYWRPLTGVWAQSSLITVSATQQSSTRCSRYRMTNDSSLVFH